MTKQTVTALAAATALLFGAAVSAQTTVEETKTVKRTDPVTGAQVTTRTETKTYDFVELDKDSDGYIVVADLPADYKLTKVWVDYDSDKDMRISRTEYDVYLTSIEVDDID